MDLKKMDPQDVVEMNRLLGLFNEIDPAELQKVADSALTPMEKMAEDLKKSQAVTRRVKGAQLKRKKLHWKTKAKRQREYYQKHTKHKRVIKKGSCSRPERKDGGNTSGDTGTRRGTRLILRLRSGRRRCGLPLRVGYRSFGGTTRMLLSPLRIST